MYTEKQVVYEKKTSECAEISHCIRLLSCPNPSAPRSERSEAGGGRSEGFTAIASSSTPHTTTPRSPRTGGTLAHEFPCTGPCLCCLVLHVACDARFLARRCWCWRWPAWWWQLRGRAQRPTVGFRGPLCGVGAYLRLGLRLLVRLRYFSARSFTLTLPASRASLVAN